jgi:hypothetical protein
MSACSDLVRLAFASGVPIRRNASANAYKHQLAVTFAMALVLLMASAPTFAMPFASAHQVKCQRRSNRILEPSWPRPDDPTDPHDLSY